MDIAKMTAVELGRKIKTKEISVREAVEAVFDRIKSVEGEYNCYVTLCEVHREVRLPPSLPTNASMRSARTLAAQSDSQAHTAELSE